MDLGLDQMTATMLLDSIGDTAAATLREGGIILDRLGDWVESNVWYTFGLKGAYETSGEVGTRACQGYQ